MTLGKTDIWVYADWKGLGKAECLGVLSAQQAKGRKAFSFEYNKEWLKKKTPFTLDPDIDWFLGQQYPNNKENFGVFMDTMPDTWGRTLMKRRAAQEARDKGIPAPILYDIDFLLSVYDETRMGALRFKTDPYGPFLDNNVQKPTPPWSGIRELQHAAQVIESDENSEEVREWLSILIAPGSSLGGARPKANIIDENGELMIAKFPSKGDELNKGLWEYLAYQLAMKSGVWMSESRVLKVAGNHHTFFTKRFDRIGKERIHFSSAMTMTGNSEDILKEETPSYLDIADFVMTASVQPDKDLEQLWRRIVFNICISNTDDHLRNHGFLLSENGWYLSPAYDLNPSVDKSGLSLNIDQNDNNLDIELAKNIGEYFRLSNKRMEEIITEVITSVSGWRTIAKQIGISRAEQEAMEAAFRF